MSEAISYNPCTKCKQKNCSFCELTYYRKEQIKRDEEQGFYYKCTHRNEDKSWCNLHKTECISDSLECPDYHTYRYKKKEPVTYCKYCFNARVYKPTEEEYMDPYNTELTDENDFSSCGVGHCHSKERRFMINSGNGHPVNIEFELLDNKTKEWYIVGRYYPKYCPECGRRLDEYNK